MFVRDRLRPREHALCMELGSGWNRSAILGAVLLGGLVGCQGHVTLQAPPASAPEEARVRTYEELRPLERNVLPRTALHRASLSTP